jgi:hypothetical protein
MLSSASFFTRKFIEDLTELKPIPVTFLENQKLTGKD